MKDNSDINNKDHNLKNSNKSSKNEYLISQIELNAINGAQKDGNNLSNNYYKNNGNYNKNIENCFNIKRLKFWLFIILAIIFLLMIISIIYLILNKEEDEDEDEDEDVYQYTFKLKYYTDNYNETISLINASFIELIYKMKIDNETINPQSEYLFQNQGDHVVYIYIKKIR